MPRKSRYENTAVKDELNIKAPGTLAAVYARISVDDGDSEIDESISNQQKIIHAFLQTHHSISLIDTYIDNGYSGMNYNRPGFQKMLLDINKGKINCVIVKDISRFGRNFIVTSEFLEKIFPEMGIRLISVNDDFDSFDGDKNVSDLIMPLKMVLNDEYARDISRKIRSSFDTRMKSGEFLPAAGSIPYGYLRNAEKCTYDIDLETAPVVVRIFQERALGISYNAIAKRLNHDSIPSPGRLRYMRGQNKNPIYANSIWLRGAIKDIVTDRAYLGERVHGKMKKENMDSKKETRSSDKWTIIKNAHPPIVTEELFERVQNVNQDVKIRRSHFKKRTDIIDPYRDALYQKIYCADCGAPMLAQKQKKDRENAKTSISYECTRYIESQHFQCGKHRISQAIIISEIRKAIEIQVKLSVDLKAMVDSIKKNPAIKAYHTDLQKKLTSLRIKKSNTSGKIENLLVDLVNSLITRMEYDYMRSQYQDLLSQIEKEEELLLTKLQQWKEVETDALRWIELVQAYSGTLEIGKELMDTLINKVCISQNGAIHIEFAFSDPFISVLSFLDATTEG
jgi:site-specific DNA recombinase